MRHFAPEEIRAIARTIGGAGEQRSANREQNDTSIAQPSALNSQPPATRHQPTVLPPMLIFWGMGIAQHSHGTDNARCLISLCLMTGNMGKPGTGLHPLRGQNNVQGASDAGPDPDGLPGLSVSRRSRSAGEIRGSVGRVTRSESGADGGGDHEGCARKGDSRDVHHGGESVPVRSRTRTRSARRFRLWTFSWCKTSF